MYTDCDMPAVGESSPLLSSLLITPNNYPILTLKWETKIR